MKPAIFCLSLFLSCPVAANAGEWAAQPLLAGRLIATLPPDTREVPAPSSIMAPTPSREVRSRFFMDIESKRLMMMPVELFVRSRKPLEASADIYSHATVERTQAKGLSRKTFEASNDLHVLQLSPVAPTKVSGAYMVTDAFVQGRDGTIIELTFFADDAEAAGSQPIMATAQKILKSLASGPRTLRSGAHTKVDGSPVTLNLPDNVSAFAESGSDFVVCRVMSLAEPNQDHDVLTIYLGDHPQPAKAPADAKIAEGRVFNHAVTWKLWDVGNTAFAEAFLKEVKAPGSVAHFDIAATTSDARERFMQIASTSTME